MRYFLKGWRVRKDAIEKQLTARLQECRDNGKRVRCVLELGPEFDESAVLPLIEVCRKFRPWGPIVVQAPDLEDDE